MTETYTKVGRLKEVRAGSMATLLDDPAHRGLGRTAMESGFGLVVTAMAMDTTACRPALDGWPLRGHRGLTR